MMPSMTWLRALALGMLFALAAGSADAATAADGPWGLRIDLSSFFEGPLGSVERVIDLRDGQWEGDIREGQIVVGLKLAIADSAVSGLMAVKAGSQFNSVSVPFHGVVADGTVERRLSGVATMPPGGDADDVETREIDIHLRLQRQ